MSLHQPRDAAEFDEASYEIDYAGYCDGEPDATLGHRLLPSEPNMACYREASVRLMGTLNEFLTFFFDHGYSKSLTLWGVAFALGHTITAGRSMLEIARELGSSKAAISKVACDFLAATGLPPSPALKSEMAKEIYKTTNGNRRRKPDAHA